MKSSLQIDDTVVRASAAEKRAGGVRSRVPSASAFKPLLFVCDLAFSYLAFLSGIWLTLGAGQLLALSIQHHLVIFFVSGVMIAFFPTYHLYMYSRIGPAISHIKLLCKSFGWSVMGLAVMWVFYNGLYTWPRAYLENMAAAGVILFFAGVCLVFLANFLWDQLSNLLRLLSICFFVAGMAQVLIPGTMPVVFSDRAILIICSAMAVGTLLVTRYVGVHLLFDKWLRRLFRRQVVIIGTDLEAKNIATHIIERDAPLWIAGTISTRGRAALNISVVKECLGELNHLPDIAEQNNITEIIVTDENLSRRALISLLDFCISEKIRVWFPPKLMPIIDMKLRIDSFYGIPMIRLCSQCNAWLFNKFKHTLDALIILPMLVLLLPVFLIIALAIKLNSRGPVFYRAKAVGKGGRIFSMYKFRSMTVDNDDDIHKKYVNALIKGEIGKPAGQDQVLKITDDPRVTAVGRFLRKFSLDELPQVFNVAKGDMSLVGPRPCLPYEYEIYKEWHKKRTFIRPGITGIWQVTGRSTVAFEDMILLDLYYIYNRHLLLDLNILFETIFVVLRSEGAH